MLALGITTACGLSGCGRSIPNPDYTVVESLGSKIKTAGVGYKYDFYKGTEAGKPEYTIEPNYKGMLKNALLADNYFLKDQNGKTLYNVDGEIITLSAKHRVFNPKGKQELEISRQFCGSLFDRIGRLLFSKDGYYVKKSSGENLLDIRETWASVWSPFLREYTITNPKSGKEIGMIKSRLTGKSLLGAQTYDISLNEKTPENEKNLALAIRVIDGIEDEEEESSSSSSNSSSD